MNRRGFLGRLLAGAVLGAVRGWLPSVEQPMRSVPLPRQPGADERTSAYTLYWSWRERFADDFADGHHVDVEYSQREATTFPLGRVTVDVWRLTDRECTLLQEEVAVLHVPNRDYEDFVRQRCLKALETMRRRQSHALQVSVFGCAVTFFPLADR